MSHKKEVRKAIKLLESGKIAEAIKVLQKLPGTVSALGEGDGGENDPSDDDSGSNPPGSHPPGHP